MTRYLLDARTATPHFPGIGRYVSNLARALPPLLAPGEQLSLLRDPISPFSVRGQWAVPRRLWQLRADVYHSPYYLMPYRPGRPTVLTAYDLIPLLLPAHGTARARLLFRLTMALALRAAAHVIAISQATRADLLVHFRLAPERVTVIPLAADPRFRPPPAAEIERARSRYGLPPDYVLYVGSNRPHKNLVRLIEGWGLALRSGLPAPGPRSLVIAGAWDPRYPETRRRAQALGLEESVRFPGPVAEEDLPGVYAGAALFVFPGLCEGFGLPVLEALACGAPVACSRASSLPEVAGEAALYFDPLDPQAVAGAVRRALLDADLRAELRERGLARAAAFRWERTAGETLAVYRRVRAAEVGFAC